MQLSCFNVEHYKKVAITYSIYPPWKIKLERRWFSLLFNRWRRPLPLLLNQFSHPDMQWNLSQGDLPSTLHSLVGWFLISCVGI